MATLDVLSSAEASAAISSPGIDSSKLSKIVTAASLRLDVLVGPVVRRTITAERHVDLEGRSSLELRRWPVVSASSVVEYDRSGSSTELTAETHSTKPADGYRLTPTRREPELGLYGPIVDRRADGHEETFDDTVLVTYTAGRFADTAAVDERYKEAGRILVVNLYQRLLTGTITYDDLEVPRYPFPRFAVPRAVSELLSDVLQELPDGSPLPGIA